MRYRNLLVSRILLILLFSTGFLSGIYGQAPKLKSTSWRDNWKVDLKTGSGVLLSEVPEKYLERINNVNIPLKAPGIAGIFSVKKGLTPHLEMGYQVDYMQINGKVDQGINTYNVRTKAFGNSFLVLYNLKSTKDFRPRYNYFVSYKIGAISLKNDPRKIAENGIPVLPSGTEKGNQFIKNVAVITGIGIGINYQLTNNLSLIGTFELNRSADIASDIYKIQKVFYHSPNTVNNYASLSGGICYAFNFSKQKKSSFFNSRNETEKRLLYSKIERKKGRYSKANLPPWYQHSKGI